ncbi:hypothetical protein [Frondihabitans sp. VKM Ac-2883]|uniref:hypothetical protein n=1 Tax=Frondihabitans sp. VKM Ac-2883 TaxID=2783823 RepID=UPI00188C7D26|nr:hypothetical protein [Frondihabitans sp. VKM Ac-2883]MBF4575692.1 hypothetical protein [Frondihabitans sp. VKM Ac-2883]
MKRIMAATVITAAAAATLAGCSVSTATPLVLNADSCSKLESSLGKSIDGFALQSDSKLGDKGGKCTWTHPKTGAAIFLNVENDSKSGVEVNVEEPRDKIAKDKSLTVIENDSVKNFDDSVLYTTKGTEKSTSRTFTAEDGADTKVTLITAEVAMTNAQASDVFTNLFKG